MLHQVSLSVRWARRRHNGGRPLVPALLMPVAYTQGSILPHRRWLWASDCPPPVPPRRHTGSRLNLPPRCVARPAPSPAAMLITPQQGARVTQPGAAQSLGPRATSKRPCCAFSGPPPPLLAGLTRSFRGLQHAASPCALSAGLGTSALTGTPARARRRGAAPPARPPSGPAAAAHF